MTRLKRVMMTQGLGMLLVSVGAHAQAIDAVTRRDVFNLVWQTVNERHFDTTFNGVDWAAVGARYGARLDGVGTDDAFYSLLNEMLGELRQSHFRVTPPATVLAPVGAALADVGLTVRLVGLHAVVTGVAAGTGAATAGLVPGMTLTRVGDVGVDSLVRELAGRAPRAAVLRQNVTRAVRGLLRGSAGTTVRVVVADTGGLERTIEMQRAEVPTAGVPPALVDWRFAHPTVGYVRLRAFQPPALPLIREAVRAFHDATGIVIDLRGNGGGIAGVAEAIASLFVKESTTLGTRKFRYGEVPLAVPSDSSPFAGPVAIIVDETSASAAEILAGGLQALGRALVVGQPSLGAMLSAVNQPLPGGGVLQYAIADYRTPRGVSLEGRGVAPDIPVEATREDITTGRDRALEAAVEAVRRSRP